MESFCIAVFCDSVVSGGIDNLCGVTVSWCLRFSTIDRVLCCLPCAAKIEFMLKIHSVE
jgi:hypothetical protein